MAYPNQNIGNEVAHGSRDHAIVSDTVKICLILTLSQKTKENFL